MDVQSFLPLSSPAPLLYVLASLLLVPPLSSRTRTSAANTDTPTPKSTPTIPPNALLEPPADHDPYVEFGTRARATLPMDFLGPRARSTPSYNLANATMGKFCVDSLEADTMEWILLLFKIDLIGAPSQDGVSERFDWYRYEESRNLVRLSWAVLRHRMSFAKLSNSDQLETKTAFFAL